MEVSIYDGAYKDVIACSLKLNYSSLVYFRYHSNKRIEILDCKKYESGNSYKLNNHVREITTKKVEVLFCGNPNCEILVNMLMKNTYLPSDNYELKTMNDEDIEYSFFILNEVMINDEFKIINPSIEPDWFEEMKKFEIREYVEKKIEVPLLEALMQGISSIKYIVYDGWNEDNLAELEYLLTDSYPMRFYR